MNKKELLKKVGIGASQALLIAMFAGAVVVAPGGVQGTLQVLNKLFEGKDEPDYNEKKIQKALYYLRSRKLIHIQSQYQKEVFGLTNLGWLRARELAKSFGIAKPKKWDGKWRLVIFDIPDRKKGTAEVFRSSLKRLGLANLQKSIWVHPYECRDQVFYLAGEMFIKPYVRYVVAEEVTGEKDLRRRFGL